MNYADASAAAPPFVWLFISAQSFILTSRIERRRQGKSETVAPLLAPVKSTFQFGGLPQQNSNHLNWTLGVRLSLFN